MTTNLLETVSLSFRAERDVLAASFGAATRATASRSGSLPVLSGIHLAVTRDRLTVTGTDLELTVQTFAAVGDGVDGEAVVPARLVLDIVKSLSAGAVEITVVNGADVRIVGGRSAFSVRPMFAADFPRTRDPAGASVRLPAAEFGVALRQVALAASSDESRPMLTAVLMEAEGGGLRLVATDSYRLAVKDLPGLDVLTGEQKVLVPSRALGELVRMLPASGDVTLRLGERDVTFETGTARLTTRLIEGEFPNYRQLIPASHPNRLVVGREPLLDAIRRVKLLARDATPIRLRMSPDGLSLSAVTQDIGQASETLDASYSGAEMTVAFNPDYLAQGVDAVSGDEIAIDTLDALKPAVVRSVGESGYIYLLMPVRHG